MARVDGEIARLERDISVERLAAARGVALTADGTKLAGRCPFHPDGDEGVLTIDRKANTWTCTRCGTGGVIAWVTKAEGISQRHAVELLRADLASNAPSTAPGSTRRVVRHSTTVKLRTPFDTAPDDVTLLAQVASYYHATLTQTPEALAYLEGRGLKSAEMIATFKLGYANRSLAYRLPAKNRVAGAEVRGRLEKLGVFRSSGHEHFNGAVVVPIFDAVGHVARLYGRRISPRVPPGTSVHLHSASTAAGLWNVAVLATSKEVVLCRSIFDGLTVWCAGHRNVVSTCGSEGLTAAEVERLRAQGVERVKISYRRDDAGDRAAAGAARLLTDAGIEAWNVLFPNGIDANDCAAKGSLDAVGEALRKAEWLGKGKSRSTPPPTARPSSESKPSLVAPAPATLDSRTTSTEKRPTAGVMAASEAPRSNAAETTGDTLFHFEDRMWRVRRIGNARPEAMKVNLYVARDGVGFHVDSLDLYSARQRAHYVAMATVEIGAEERTIKRDLGQVLLRLEEEQDRAVAEETDKKLRPKLSAEEERAALDLLGDPRLLDRILADFEMCGIVGEADNKLVAYLAAVSRKLDHPLAVVIQSASAAGKSSLMEATLEFVPEEDRLSFSAMTGQSLFYMGADIAHRVLSVAEEQGAERAAYALKLLQSEGHLTIASTGKDPTTGRLTSHHYRVQGPVAIFTTTTAIDVDEELLSRCIVLTVDEAPEQTRAIHDRQRRSHSVDGLFDRDERARVVQLHRNAQRLLRPVAVVIPFVADLSYADQRVRARRDHRKYLALIEACAFLHQHQRAVKTEARNGRSVQYIEATAADLALANRLFAAVVSPGLDDLPATTRRLLGGLDAMVGTLAASKGTSRCDVRFSRREVRERLGVGGTQLWVHLRRLVDWEFVVVHPSGRGRGVVYELAYAARGAASGGIVRAGGGHGSGEVRPSFGPNSGGIRGVHDGGIRRDDNEMDASEDKNAANAHPGTTDGASYVLEPGA